MESAIAELRSFNRFFTQSVGALDASFLGTRMPLAEARVLYEIAQAERPLATDIQASLGLDPAYLSRVLARFEARGWITRERHAPDARRRPIALTADGRAAFDALDARQRAEVTRKLASLDDSQRAELTAALRTARRLLERGPATFTLRAFRPGDMGLIAARQAMLYREGYGWNEKLEVNVGETAFAFLRDFAAGRTQCWVAEVDGRLAGSVFVTDEGDGLARLRLLYVEPFARRLGIGDALVRQCVGFARDAGYTRLTLWTHTVLASARRLYAAHGFERVATDIHDRFGPTIQSETWELDLTVAA